MKFDILLFDFLLLNNYELDKFLLPGLINGRIKISRY